MAGSIFLLIHVYSPLPQGTCDEGVAVACLYEGLALVDWDGWKAHERLETACLSDIGVACGIDGALSWAAGYVDEARRSWREGCRQLDKSSCRAQALLGSDSTP